MAIDVNQQLRDLANNQNENMRNRQLVSSICSLAEKQRESNEILKKQCDAIQKRNKMLEDELADARHAAKRSAIINIISASIAFGSLVATILIALLN